MTFATTLTDDRGNLFLNTDEFGESVTYTPAGGVGSSVTANPIPLSDDPIRELRRFYLSSANAASPRRGDRVTHDGAEWMAFDVTLDSLGMVRFDCAKAKLTTHTDEDGVDTAVYGVFTFFVGALDENEQGLFQVSDQDVTPVEGDYFTISGETDRWFVNDVRPNPELFEVRVIRRKDRT